MKRKDFFKTLFGVTAAAVVVPHVLREWEDETPEVLNLTQLNTDHLNGYKSGYSRWESIYNTNFSPEIFKEWYEKYGKNFTTTDFIKACK